MLMVLMMDLIKSLHLLANLNGQLLVALLKDGTMEGRRSGNVALAHLPCALGLSDVIQVLE